MCSAFNVCREVQAGDVHITFDYVAYYRASKALQELPTGSTHHSDWCIVAVLLLQCYKVAALLQGLGACGLTNILQAFALAVAKQQAFIYWARDKL